MCVCVCIAKGERESPSFCERERDGTIFHGDFRFFEDFRPCVLYTCIYERGWWVCGGGVSACSNDLFDLFSVLACIMKTRVVDAGEGWREKNGSLDVFLRE